MASLWLRAVINVVLKSLNIPIKSDHLFTQVERVVGRNRGEPATSGSTCKLGTERPQCGVRSCKLLAANCPPAN